MGFDQIRVYVCWAVWPENIRTRSEIRTESVLIYLRTSQVILQGQ